jgi:hypothetical protein
MIDLDIVISPQTRRNKSHRSSDSGGKALSHLSILNPNFTEIKKPALTFCMPVLAYCYVNTPIKK